MSETVELEAKAAKKHVTIIVAGEAHQVPDQPISYKTVVSLAFDGQPPQGENVKISVTYSKGPKQNRQGTLTPGHSVEVKNEMVFNVTATDRS